MKKTLFLTGFILFIIAILSGCGNNKEQLVAKTEKVNLTVSAAASLMDAAEEIKTDYLKQHPGVNITYNFGASGTLQKQIEEGAPVDLFISAGKSQMDALADKRLIIETTRKNLIGNNLVLITAKDSKLTGLKELNGNNVTKIGIGTPETVPAGKYAQEALLNLNLWDNLQPKLVLAKDVRQVLTYVESGNVDAGFVYRSDTLSSEKIKIVTTISTDSHKPIVYPMAVIESTKYPQEIKEFTSYLLSEEAGKIFAKYGFS